MLWRVNVQRFGNQIIYSLHVCALNGGSGGHMRLSSWWLRRRKFMLSGTHWSDARRVSGESRPGCSKHPEEVGILNCRHLSGTECGTTSTLSLFCCPVMKTLTLSRGQWHQGTKHRQSIRACTCLFWCREWMRLPTQGRRMCHTKTCLFGRRVILCLSDKDSKRTFDLSRNCRKHLL